MKFLAKIGYLIEKILETKDDALSERANVVRGIGTDVSPDGQGPSPASRAIALKVLELYQKGLVENILFVGGYSFNNGPAEAEIMASLIEEQVSSRWLYLEKESYYTHLNARKALQIVVEYNWRNVIIVAQQWHARRVRLIFKKFFGLFGIQVKVIKARSLYGGSSQKRLSHPLLFLIWDTLAVIYCYLRGYC